VEEASAAAFFVSSLVEKCFLGDLLDLSKSFEPIVYQVMQNFKSHNKGCWCDDQDDDSDAHVTASHARKGGLMMAMMR